MRRLTLEFRCTQKARIFAKAKNATFGCQLQRKVRRPAQPVAPATHLPINTLNFDEIPCVDDFWTLLMETGPRSCAAKPLIEFSRWTIL
jgi:hypothetical protein